MINFKSILCQHDYDIIDKVTTKSIYDELVEAGAEIERCTNLSVFEKRIITKYKCKKCNKITKKTDYIN